MIPSDLAARLRMLTEASFFSGEPTVAPLARVREVPANLPDFLPGQRIVARLQQSGPDNTFKALVEGRSVTLALPQTATPGDTLELVVSHVTPAAVFATQAGSTALPGAQTGTALSQAGRLISFLLTGQPPAQAASLNGGQPVLASPPGPGDTDLLAQRLGAALGDSGLFYESHQARWLAGQVDMAQLTREPQGRPAVPSAAPTTALQTGTAALPEAAQPGATPQIPDRLLPVVHQQLDALATQHLVWQGQIWPGQTMEWEIEDPARDGPRADDDPAPTWNTTLRLSLPTLGGVEARLHLTPAGVALRLTGDSADTVAALRAGQPRLAEALAAANLPLTGVSTEQREPA